MSSTEQLLMAPELKMLELLKNVGLDAHLILHLDHGTTVSGYLNEWDWDAGILNLRTNRHDQTTQLWVMANRVVAFYVTEDRS